VLESEEYTTVYQHRDFPSDLADPTIDSNFIRKMHQALAAAKCTLALLSPQYLQSRFCEDEWTAAFHLKKLQPVRLQKCVIPGLLAPLAYIDLVELSEDKAKEALLAGLRRTPLDPDTRPPFPGGEPSKPLSAPSFRFPGAFPPIWNVPHGRNPNFTGREELLTGLREALASGAAAALTQAQAIHGLGGVGKTALAVEYAYRYAPEYDIFWWVRSEEAATLAAYFAGLAQRLADIPPAVKTSPDQGVIVAAVRAWLRQHPGWLLVFDNVEKPEDLKEYRPQGGPGHVLITSRNPVWGRVARPLEVRVLPREQSVEFLLKRTGQEDENAAKSLAAAQGDLPLALEQAGAYMEETGTPLAEYLQLFQERRLELWGEEKPPDDYHATVATTWSLALEKVKEEAPAAADLLNLCAFLAPDDIPLSLLPPGTKLLPEGLAQTVADELVFNKALAALKRFSFIERGEDSLSVHRLVQAVVRDRMDEEEQKTWAGAAAELVNEVFPGGDLSADVRAWPMCARLLPHARAAAHHAEENQVALPAAGRLLNQSGLYLKDRAEFAAAKSFYEQALPITEAAYGATHPNFASNLNNLGGVLKEMGDLKGARVHYERALAIDEAAYGPDHPEVAIRVNNLGLVLQAQGDLAAAKAHFARALAIFTKFLGEDHPDTQIVRGNLAGVLAEMEKT